MKHMTSNSPYLLRAYYDWISDNLLTPYIVVDTRVEGIQVPTEYIENDQIVLNILSSAVRDFDISKEAISFQARFRGVVFNLWIPIESVRSIYAQENGIGFMFFNEQASSEPEEEAMPDLEDKVEALRSEQEKVHEHTVTRSSREKNDKPSRTHLRVIK